MIRDRDEFLGVLAALLDAPTRAGLEDVARVVLEHHSRDVEVGIALCAAWNACAALRPLDAPAELDGPAARAASHAARLLETTPDEAYLWINRANALRRCGRELDADAQQAYARALALEPSNGHWWFDLGVLHKWRGRFDQAIDCFLRARARIGETRAVRLNLAICATGAGQGDIAAGVWRDLGLAVSLHAASRLPVVEALPAVRVRAPSRPSGYGDERADPVSYEVLWVAPISPCHGVVQSPAFQETPVDYGDVVLWDAEPVGASDRSGPVFPVLERLVLGTEHRLRFAALIRDGELEQLREVLDLDVRIFAHRGPSGVCYGKLIYDGELATLGAAWERSVRALGLRVAIPGLYDASGSPKRAGQEHQAWRGIERAAAKQAGA